LQLESGEHGLLGGLAALNAEEELKSGPGSATAQLQTTVELHALDQHLKSKPVQPSLALLVRTNKKVNLEV